jgi:hypothetical protein
MMPFPHDAIRVRFVIASGVPSTMKHCSELRSALCSGISWAIADLREEVERLLPTVA